MANLKCSYDSGSATDCVPLCTDDAVNIVRSRNGSYGPLDEPVCAYHTGSAKGRAYPGVIAVIPIGA